MWNVLDRFAEQIRLYSTPVGQLWNTVTFVFRLFVIVAVGSSVYGDEQGAFKCDTGQPGCQNVCFNRFSPISHMRFWAFQILFVSTPAMFFYMYAGTQTGRVKKLEQEKKTLKEKIDDADKADEAEKLIDDDDDGRKSMAAMSLCRAKSIDVCEQEKLVERLQKKIGRYKEKQVNEMIKGGTLTQVIFTTRVRIVYIMHCVIKLALECTFLYLAYHLQHFQSKTWGWQCWTVPEKYVCTHALDYGAAGSACAQQEKVTCWVSRPYEKQIFLYYMTSMTLISIVLIVLEALYMIFRVSRKGLQRRAMKTIAHRESTASHSGYPGYHGYDTMMSTRSGINTRKSLASMNASRWAALSRKNSTIPPSYQFAGSPLVEDFLPDDGSPIYAKKGRKGSMYYPQMHQQMPYGYSVGHNGMPHGAIPNGMPVEANGMPNGQIRLPTTPGTAAPAGVVNPAKSGSTTPDESK